MPIGPTFREIERHCEIIDVSREEARAGITNGLLLQDEILCDSDIFQTGKGSQNYTIEKHKTKHLEQICSRFGYSLRIFCVSEFYKSGALLSCLIMPIKQVVKLVVQNAAVFMVRLTVPGSMQPNSFDNL